MATLLDLLGQELTSTALLLLVMALLLALGFEFVNGFHDTANAVATVIYTRSLPPGWAVVWSGLWNLIGVLVSSGLVAYSIVALLPVELVLNVDSGAGFAMVFALLLAAILWNLGTWYLGLPASSSHTLIGSILGIGLTHAVWSAGLTPAQWGQGLNWVKVQEVFLALLISPLLGFVGAGLLLLLAQTLLFQPALDQAPKDEPPPFWIRTLLILTCTGVSFAHGSNDGQKGMGLIMLILVGLLPGLFALNLSLSSADLAQLTASLEAATLPPLTPAFPADLTQSRSELESFLAAPVAANPASQPVAQSASQPVSQPVSRPVQPPLIALSQLQQDVLTRLSPPASLAQLSRAEKLALRDELYLISASLNRLEQQGQLPSGLDHQTVAAYQQSLKTLTQFIPVWVKLAVALALGLGTTVG